MRIALFCGNYNYLREGANQALNRLVAFCERQGDNVRVYSPVTDTPAFEPAGTLVAVPSVTLPLRSEFQLALGLPRAIRRDVAAFAPDLVHVSSPDILGHRAQTFARRLGVPVVASFHTRFETYLVHYRLGWTHKAVVALLHRFYRRSDLVLVPSAAIRDELAPVVGPERLRIWSRGVDRDLFSPARRDRDWRRGNGWADEDLVVLFFGRLVVEKGIDDFVAAIRRLRAGGRKVRVLVAGGGPDAARFDSLDDAVRLGHLEGVSLARAVASADILLHPSLTESFGNVVVEAMASELAVVCADTPAAREILRHGETGLICPADPGALADAIARLADSPAERARLGKAARAASAGYSWESASSAARAAYGELLDRVR